MEAVALKLPETLKEDELLVVPATWEEYVGLLDETPYTIQFLNGELFMGQASEMHETLVGVLIWLFNNIYIDSDLHRVLGSNIKIVIPDQLGDVNADVSVVKDPVEYGATPGGNISTARIKNPEIVVEVLSKSTRTFDSIEKLDYYKLIPSLNYILLVDQDRPQVSVYSRTNVPNEWLNHDYRSLDETVRLGDVTLPMAAIYRKSAFGKPAN
ncbi:Uma2 family endonuclease [Spirosoma rhododendri]|uniref:Uma2 family endonuclease n=1 Tax=Spirosoma rhododendri TaxID=2728024 RepID=A0A7L5DL05_9BACT|nr:Uma2 family endonuclease [Spirosoma rhododendri]QJD78212.1 Uma2 family endonuclease [Spirosoma rhododendri]